MKFIFSVSIALNLELVYLRIEILVFYNSKTFVILLFQMVSIKKNDDNRQVVLYFPQILPVRALH